MALISKGYGTPKPTGLAKGGLVHGVLKQAGF